MEVGEGRGPQLEKFLCRRRELENESEFAGKVGAAGRRDSMDRGMESLNSVVMGVSGR